METTRALELRLKVVRLMAAAGAAALLAAGCGGHKKPKETTGSISDSVAAAIGTVECATGRPVEGVWVDVANGHSGWAEWAAEPNNPDRASYSYELQMAGKYTVHVGCGGSPENWASETWSEPVASGETHDFMCHDSLTKPSTEPIVACEPASDATTSTEAIPTVPAGGRGPDVLVPDSSHPEIVQFSSGSPVFIDYRHKAGLVLTLPQGAVVETDCLVVDKDEANDSTHGLWYHLIGPKAVRGLFTPSNNFENGVDNPNAGPAADPKVPPCP
jgi:hypothetical protein